MHIIIRTLFLRSYWFSEFIPELTLSVMDSSEFSDSLRWAKVAQ